MREFSAGQRKGYSDPCFGGGRIIYDYFFGTSRIALLLAYPKNAQGDLTAAQKKILIKVIETWS